jgi:succinyl-diaminopimelate desuccinylase
VPASVLALARDLIAVPSRGGIDDYAPVVAVVRDWLTAHGLPVPTLTDDSGVAGLTCEIVGGHPGPTRVLNACLDTAPFGDEAAWTDPPTSALVRDGWLHGRVALLFDLDEHTGGFGGARAFFAGRTGVAGVLIGYPGLDTTRAGRAPASPDERIRIDTIPVVLETYLAAVTALTSTPLE